MPTASAKDALQEYCVYTAPCFAIAADGSTMMLLYEGVSKRSPLSESVTVIAVSPYCSGAKAGTSTPSESIVFTVKRIYTSGVNALRGDDPQHIVCKDPM